MSTASGQKLLPAKAGVDAHHQNIVHHGQDFDERLDRGGRVDDDAGQHVVFDDVLEGAVQVAADLLMHGDHVGAGLGEGGDEGVGVLDHQVAVERQLGDGAQGLDHGRAEGDVGDKVAVHDIDVDDGAAAALGRGDFVGEMGEVGGEDGEASSIMWVRCRVRIQWKCIERSVSVACLRSEAVGKFRCASSGCVCAMGLGRRGPCGRRR